MVSGWIRLQCTPDLNYELRWPSTQGFFSKTENGWRGFVVSCSCSLRKTQRYEKKGNTKRTLNDLTWIRIAARQVKGVFVLLCVSECVSPCHGLLTVHPVWTGGHKRARLCVAAATPQVRQPTVTGVWGPRCALSEGPGRRCFHLQVR